MSASSALHRRIYGVWPTAPALATKLTPADSTDKIITVPADELWRVYSVLVELVTDANAANRWVILKLRDAADTVFFVTAAASQVVASQTANISFVPGAGIAASGNSNYQTSPLPDPCYLEAGYDALVTMEGEQAADTLKILGLLYDKIAA